MDISFYETKEGNSPIAKFIDQSPKIDQAVILAVFSDIESHGLAAKGAIFRQLDGKLWEIKIKTPGGGYRFLYVLLDKASMMLVHAFKKKTQKTPLKELDLARKRVAEIL